MSEQRYRAGIIGLGFIGGADQVSGDALGQSVSGLDGTHYYGYANHSRVDLVCGSTYTVTARLVDPANCQTGPPATTVHTHTC